MRSDAGSNLSAGGTVSSLSESELIARIQSPLPAAPPWTIVGIGDDAAVVEPERNRLEVLTVDGVVEGVHFDRAFVPADAIGHRALAVNLSDLAAMGAAPRLALLAMALPPALPIADFDAIVSGLSALAREHKVHVVGGNLTRTPGPLTIDVTLAGTVKRRQVLTRGGAKSGDDVYVSGAIGSARAGLALLKASGASPETRDSRLASAYLRPVPRVRLGVWLGRNRAATACIDLSDGLSDGVHRIAEASGVGIALDACALPIDDEARTGFSARGADPILEAVTGGDDYELLFTASPRARRRIDAAARHAGLSVTRIGACTKAPAVVLRRDGVETPLPHSGYTHFGAA